MLTICHPGRYGDLFWALPTVRQLCEKHSTNAQVLLPTDPANTTPMDVLLELLKQQPYIDSVKIIPEWSIIQDAPRRPLLPPFLEGSESPALFALGYRSWPERPLPYEVAHLAGDDIYNMAVCHPDYFFRPWITAWPTTLSPRRPNILVHWTDRYFELKLGILKEIERCLPDVHVEWYAQEGSRMCNAGATPVTFDALATAMAHDTKVVLTDCSAAHVLAAGVGVKHVLVVEPEEARHHFVFWPGSVLPAWEPMGTPLGQRIKPVLGGDHKPTFDSRHVIEAVLAALQEG